MNLRILQAVEVASQAAAATLYCGMEDIDNSAEQQGQLDQSSESHEIEWTRLVAEVIANELRKHLDQA